ncbi:RpiB/LacA/LacB family sugar-phosphate isomerase [Candidatus Saccharibacteria bacterium]|nr:MAG: RpiB/LacA/LacB family sugar-phosphate isomerase [Candidatus Saccharibacteria bacterium]
MKIFLGADHQGYHLKEKIELYLAKQGYEVEDIGNDQLDPDDDFPQFAQMAVIKVLGELKADDPRAILICGSGQGMCMAANRFKGIRASLGWDSHEARMTRIDNDSNVLCLPARVLNDDAELWTDIIDVWLKTEFADAPRFNRRNAELDEF